MDYAGNGNGNGDKEANEDTFLFSIYYNSKVKNLFVKILIMKKYNNTFHFF
jgi:hypothetical protein